MEKKILLKRIFYVILFLLIICLSFLYITKGKDTVKTKINKTETYFHITKSVILNSKGIELYDFGEGPFVFFKNGDYITDDHKQIKKVNPDGNIEWFLNISVHHEIEIGEDNYIYVLSTDNHSFMGKDTHFDTIIKISPDGEYIDKWSTYDHLDRLLKLHSHLEPQHVEKRNIFDYYHANSIDYIKENENSDDPRFKVGNLIVCLSHANLIIIIDQDTKEIVWSWGPGELDFEHTPRMMRNGHIIIFENGENRGYSRIIELDPIKKKIVWEYTGNPKESFFSDFNGAVEELPNGNLLVTESVKGHVFELTKKKKILWHYYSTNPEDILIYRAAYVPKDIVDLYINKTYNERYD